MVKLDRDALNKFQLMLENVDETWQTEFNLRETVRQSFELIREAKKYKVSWEKIADLLKQSSGITDRISPESIRQYYFEFAKNPDLLPKKKARSGKRKNKQESSTSVANSANIESKHLEDLNTFPSNSPETVAELEHVKPQQPSKDELKSQFNLGRRGK